MFNKIVIFLALAVICVSSECEKESQLRQYTRVKRGKYYSNPPIRFYNRPPPIIPVKGPFSYTPPPFMADEEPPYPGNRPYKVSKRPSPPKNDGLGDEDIANLVKYMSKQDLDKILEFAQSKDQNYNKYKDVYSSNEFIQPYKRENKYFYKGNSQMKYEELTPFKDESKFGNYVTEPSFVSFFNAHESSKPVQVNTEDRPSPRDPLDSGNRSPNEWIPNAIESFSASQGSLNSQSPVNFQTPNNQQNEATYVNVFTAQEPSKAQAQFDVHDNSQASEKFQGPDSPVFNNIQVTQTNEEENLPPPVNIRDEFVISYTNDVPKVVKPDSYNIENFGDLPLMDYNSKLHDVSSYHVPHYTVTQPKPSKPSSAVSFPSSSSSSSSALLKPSPGSADIKEPVYEPAPSKSAAAEQSDAHLKATKIWSYKSNGAAYTLHDDGSLTPERHRPNRG